MIGDELVKYKLVLVFSSCIMSTDLIDLSIDKNVEKQHTQNQFSDLLLVGNNRLRLAGSVTSRMPMGISLPFHVQLRYERERCGWSQADVASKVGSDPKTVARWERGTSLPRPYHRQALCALFGKNAEEFGLISEKRAISHLPLPETGSSPLPPEGAIPGAIASHPDGKARAYQSIVGFPPPTSPRTIQQREGRLRSS